MNNKQKQKIFSEKIEPEYIRTFNFIYSRVYHDKELAQDLTQSTMELAWYKLEHLRDMRSAKSWVLQIAMNEIRRYFRAQNTMKRGAYQEVSYEVCAQENLNDMALVEGDSLDEIIEREDTKLFMEALSNVKEKYRVILDLRLIQDLKFSEIAEILNLKEVTARVNYRRGLELLRKEYNLLIGEEN